jgi:hypothetical protein
LSNASQSNGLHCFFFFFALTGGRNVGAAFFQTAAEMAVRIVYKAGAVGGIFGAGKEGKRAEADPQHWTRDRAHLYDDKTRAAVGALQVEPRSSFRQLFSDFC